MCGELRVILKYKDCLDPQNHAKMLYEYPVEERCDHPQFSTQQCPNIKTSKSQKFGLTRVKDTCPYCCFELAQTRPVIGL